MDKALGTAIFGHIQLLSAKIDTLIQASQETMLQRPYPNHEPYNFSKQDGFLFHKPQLQSNEVTHQFQRQRDFPQIDYFINQGSSSQNQGGLCNSPSLEDENMILIKKIMEGQSRADNELNNNIEKINNNIEEMNNKVEVVVDEINVKFEGLRSRAMELENKLAQHKSSLKSHEEETSMENPESYLIDYCFTIEEEEDCEKEHFLFEVDMTTKELQELFGCGVRENYVKRHGGKVLNNELVKDTCEKVLNVACTQEAKGVSKVGEGISSEVEELVDKERDHMSKDATTKADLDLEIPLHKLQLPFPGRFKKQILEEIHKKYFKDPLSIDHKLLEIVKENPKLEIFLKDLVAKRVKHKELMRKNGILPPIKEEKRLPKLKNPGKFMVPCLLENIHEEKGLVDTGADVNVISLDTVKKYGIKDLIKPTSPIGLIDSSIRKPIGKIEDYPLRVDDCIVSTDFVIVEMNGKSKYLLLLGSPFLETVGTMIDYKTKSVILANIDPKKSYKMINANEGYCWRLH